MAAGRRSFGRRLWGGRGRFDWGAPNGTIVWVYIGWEWSYWVFNGTIVGWEWSYWSGHVRSGHIGWVYPITCISG